MKMMNNLEPQILAYRAMLITQIELLMQSLVPVLGGIQYDDAMRELSIRRQWLERGELDHNISLHIQRGESIGYVPNVYHSNRSAT
jgi:hypothetical protein